MLADRGRKGPVKEESREAGAFLDGREATIKLRLPVCGRSSLRRKPIEAGPAVRSAKPRTRAATPGRASLRQPARCRAREQEERPAGLAAEKANGRDVCTVGAHSGRIARRRLGAALEVAGFDGWSLRSTAKTRLEARPGWRSASRARPHFPMIGRIPGGFSRHWKKSPAVFQALEKTRQRPSREKPRRSGAAKRRTKQAARSFRPRGLRSFLAGCAA